MKKGLSKKGLLLGLGLVVGTVLLAQTTPTFNQLTTSNLEASVGVAATSGKNIVFWILAAVLAMGTLYVVYQIVMEGGQKSKGSIIALIVGYLVVGLAKAVGVL